MRLKNCIVRAGAAIIIPVGEGIDAILDLDPAMVNQMTIMSLMEANKMVATATGDKVARMAAILRIRLARKQATRTREIDFRIGAHIGEDIIKNVVIDKRIIMNKMDLVEEAMMPQAKKVVQMEEETS